MLLKFDFPVSWVEVTTRRHHRIEETFDPPVRQMDITALQGIVQPGASVLIRARGVSGFEGELRHPWREGNTVHVNLTRPSIWGKAPLPIKVGILAAIVVGIVGGFVALQVVETTGVLEE